MADKPITKAQFLEWLSLQIREWDKMIIGAGTHATERKIAFESALYMAQSITDTKELEDKLKEQEKMMEDISLWICEKSHILGLSHDKKEMVREIDEILAKHTGGK